MQTLLQEKKLVGWDFKGVNTKYCTHGLHTYPAMMIPQIASGLIELYGADSKTIFDPFVGSGTTMVEASLHNSFVEAYGVDINPLALLIAKVKTTKIDLNMLEEEYLKLLNRIRLNKTKKFDKPDFGNIGFWFKPSVINDLNAIKNCIGQIGDKNIRDFFLVAFSETVRSVSNTRNGEFKLYRIEESRLKKFDPNTIKKFKETADYYFAKLKE